MCIKIGISKRELFEEYYPDEINVIVEKYAELNKQATSDEKEVEADDF